MKTNEKALIAFHRRQGGEDFYEIGAARPSDDPLLYAAYMEGFRQAELDDAKAEYAHRAAIDRMYDRTR